MSPPHSELFEEAIRVTPLTSHTYSAHLQKDWCIGNVPHGGYTTAILYRLTTTHFAQSDTSPYRSKPVLPISFQLTFVRPTQVGPATLTVQEVKLGARTSTIQVTLSQDAASKGPQTKVVGYITVSPIETDQEGPVVKGTPVLHPNPPPGSKPDGGVDFTALAKTGRDGQWTRFPTIPAMAVSQHTELYGTPPPSTVQERIKSTVDQWARFRPGGQVPAQWTNEALMCLLDLFPMALDRLGAMATSAWASTNDPEDRQSRSPGPFWFPTVSFNVDLKKSIPKEGVAWLHSRVVTQTLRAGRADISVEILDQNGELIAISSQVCMVVGFDRNLKNGDRARPTQGKL
ncbi:thioesterase-like superfamily-domain-containing protein [Aspergillus caelatus]|uniref:Thioesterase-like superfamily-domain-containing protein n=1 Tax=Aspergillus caelatus TaxID=61420 RepID=A0A5N7AJ67_9EURO|nr:thioesterase-like superfamily-domain-containing protein [Aspergillus caelatus]KAE8369941.1 thioesterase-like superfamily-domain-containing protein [Aspergillus caelatus]